MDQYLLQILKETNTIIIPGLGALTITNATTGEVMFMPYLKHDDGKLSAHIAEKEGIEDNEAKIIVAKHVREIQTSLDKGDSYDMYQFGTFTKGSDGDIEFKNWEGDKKTEAPKAEPKVEKPVVAPAPKKEEKKAEPKKEVKKETPKVEAVKEEKPKAESKPKAEPKKPAVEKPVAKKEEEKAPVKPKAEVKPKAPEKKEEAKAPIIEAKKENPKAETPKPEKKVEVAAEEKLAPIVTKTVDAAAPQKEMNIAKKEELSKSVDKLDKLKKDNVDSKTKKKRGVGFYMLMIFILLIVAGGTYFAIDYDNLKQHVPFLADTEVKKDEPKELDKLKENIGGDEEDVNNSEEEEEEEEEDSEVIEELEDEEPVDEEVVKPVVVETPEPVVSNNGSNDQPFHIVAGAFSSADNAARLVEKIKAMGYPAKVIVRGSQNVVSVQSYATKAEAQAAIPSVQDAAPKGWVLEWR